MSQQYDLTDAVPEADAPVETPIKTPCIGGPWHGATITHLPGDTKPRHPGWPQGVTARPGVYLYEDDEEAGMGVWLWRTT